jgi:3-keto-5-aminohexanoate cleavage enzyme
VRKFDFRENTTLHKVWIEAALNGPWSRKFQPGIPDTVETIVAEGIACARAGATVVHVHAYDGGGPQTHDWQVYARIIEGIRNQIDVPVYPSYPAYTTDGDAGLADISARYAHIEALAERGLLEFALLDPGSVNFTLTNTTSTAKPAGTYMNPEDHIRYVLDFAARHKLYPDFAIYEPGFMRAGAALARVINTRIPIYRLMFCNQIAVGFPPRPYALSAYLALLEEEAPGAPWMTAGVSADIRPLIGETVRRGGHIRVGLEDAPLGTKAGNLEMVEEAVRLVRENGAEPASPDEMRQALRSHNL